MFSSFGEFMSRSLMVFIFIGVTLAMLYKRFAAENPEGAKKAGEVAVKVGFGLLRKILKRAAGGTDALPTSFTPA